jgi:glycosyltransferase involved in cell wall biosynthesis
MNSRPEISVVVPMHNEAANLPDTLVNIALELNKFGRTFEVIAVNDGSSDGTGTRLSALRHLASWLVVVDYQPNRGRGYAIREGFQQARGDIICTIDADLSYTPDHLPKMIRILDRYQRVDCVIGSPYVDGGGAENVAWWRLWLSRWGNRIIRRAMGGLVKTSTGVLRAYRARCIKALELFADGKELHLEIVSKLLATGYNIIEMPAILRGRKRGRSKFNFRAIASSHLLFSLHEKPILLFGMIGLFLIGLGLLGGGYIIYLWQSADLNPNRPLMTLVPLLILTGIQVLVFGFLGSGLARLRREILVVQRENKELERQLENLSSQHQASKPGGTEIKASETAGVDQPATAGV